MTGSALLSFLLFQSAVPPGPPPYGVAPEKLSLMIAILSKHPSESDPGYGTDYEALAPVAEDALRFTKLARDPVARAKLLYRLVGQLQWERPHLGQDILSCMARPIASRLSMEELRDIDRFADTPLGTKFFSVAGVGAGHLRECYRQIVSNVRVTEDDLTAVGVKPREAKRALAKPREATLAID
ncbi:MAG: hypothetical protein QOH81_2537 [Sphingomonadales bacterium]|jgi:hypothetical protein|nr:hypothetical protein [Sphingomonadales bacterium]